MYDALNENTLIETSFNTAFKAWKKIDWSDGPINKFSLNELAYF